MWRVIQNFSCSWECFKIVVLRNKSNVWAVFLLSFSWEEGIPHCLESNTTSKSLSGPPREAAGGTMTLGPMDFRGPIRRPMGSRGTHHGARWLQSAQQKAHGLQRAHQNDAEKSVCGRPKIFLFGDHIKILRKLWHFPWRPFFWDHIKIWTKLWYFPRLFWSSQNRRCLIFKLTPRPCLALGAPGHYRSPVYLYLLQICCLFCTSIRCGRQVKSQNIIVGWQYWRRGEVGQDVLGGL